jgi:hypothetical protein
VTAVASYHVPHLTTLLNKSQDKSGSCPLSTGRAAPVPGDFIRRKDEVHFTSVFLEPRTRRPRRSASRRLSRRGPGWSPNRTRARHADVHCLLLEEGRNFREIAIGLGLSRNTVRRFARADSPEELLVKDGIGRQASSLD